MSAGTKCSHSYKGGKAMTKTPPTKEQRQEWQRLADAATPGPWRAGCEDMVNYHGIYGSPFKAVYWDDPEAEMHMGHTLPGLISEAYDAGEVDCRDNAGFIAAARTAVPSLLAAVDTLEADRNINLADFANECVAELAHLRGIEAAAKAWLKDCAEYSCYEERCNSKVAALLSDILAGRGPT